MEFSFIDSVGWGLYFKQVEKEMEPRIWPLFVYGLRQGRELLFEPYNPERLRFDDGDISTLLFQRELLYKAIAGLLIDKMPEMELPFDTDELIRNTFSQDRPMDDELLNLYKTLLAAFGIGVEECYSSEDVEILKNKFISIGYRLEEEHPFLKMYADLATVRPDPDGWLPPISSMPDHYLERIRPNTYRLWVQGESILGCGWLIERLSELIPEAEFTPLFEAADGKKPLPRRIAQGGENVLVHRRILLGQLRIPPEILSTAVDLIQWWLNWTNPWVTTALIEEWQEWDAETVALLRTGALDWDEGLHYPHGFDDSNLDQAYAHAQQNGLAHLWPLRTGRLYPMIPPNVGGKMLPWPVSIRYEQLLQEPASQQELLVGLLEIAERVVAFLGICICRALQAEAGLRPVDIIEDWHRMSFGSWGRIIGRNWDQDMLSNESFLQAIYAYFGSQQIKESIKRLLHLRNHGAGLHPVTRLPEGECRSLAEKYKPDVQILHFFLARLFEEWEFIVPELNGRRLMIRRLMGLTNHELRTLPDLPSDVVAGEPCLIKGNTRISLYPLLVWDECPKCGMKEMFFYQFTESREAHYASLSTHHQFQSRDLWHILRDEGYV